MPRIPIVATGVGGVAEAMHDGVDALLVPPGHATALADALQRVLSDGELRNRVAAAAAARAPAFAVTRAIRRLEQIYADFDVTTADDPKIGTVWLLNSTNTGNLLLWGPLTADDTVRGIYAPDACGRF